MVVFYLKVRFCPLKQQFPESTIAVLPRTKSKLPKLSKMPLTEFVTPSLKQDAESRESFLAQIPGIFKPITTAPGLVKSFSGLMISKNNVDVTSEFHFVLGLGNQLPISLTFELVLTSKCPEWKEKHYFNTLIASDEFKAFGGKVKGYATAPPEPQLFETDKGPAAAMSAPVTEVFRIKIHDRKNIDHAWKDLVDAVGKAESSVETLSGASINLPYDLFVGVMGWDSLEVIQSSLFLSLADSIRLARKS